MTIPKSVLIGVAAAVVAYGGMYGLGKVQVPSDARTAMLQEELPSTATPTATTAKPLPSTAKTTATKVGSGLAPHVAVVAVTLAPTATPTPQPSVTPRASISPTPAPTATAQPSTTVTPWPTTTVSPTPTPTATATPVPTATGTPTPTPGPVVAQVVINEIAWMGTATSSNDEWMELYNAGSQAVDLSGWTLGISAKNPITLSGSIAPGAYYLLERTDDQDVSDIVADYIYTGALADAGEVLVLRDAAGVERDRVDAWYAGTKAPKATMERISATGSGVAAANWATNTGAVTTGSDAAGQPIVGTPKFKNSVTP